MIITYIHHSSFSIEMEDVVMLFDYYKGNIPSFDRTKQIYVFSSHKHHDHFDLSIFQLVNHYPNITFLLSKDIRMSGSFMNRNNIPESVKEKIIYVGKNETLTLPIGNDSSMQNPITLETLESTDEGIAFLITYKDKVIYHAGDLNWWTWKGETEKEYEDMTRRFKNEVDKLKDRHIDVAFLPLDVRQEERFFWGFDYFMKTTDTTQAFPMHFWSDYSVIPHLKNLEEAKEYAHKVADITKEDQIFNI
jgi:L-ascorbate metabolism protein UlaG (beta-lactamase superfamily)